MDRWQKYYKDTLNGKEEEINEDENEDTETETEITITEVEEALKQLKNWKVAGIDNIKAEMLKCMVEKGTNMLHKIINKAWKKGKLPKDWTTAVILLCGDQAIETNSTCVLAYLF